MTLLQQPQISSEVSLRLRRWAAHYETAAFIPDDPVSVPHLFSSPTDVEISGFLTAQLSFGYRPLILRAARRLCLEVMDGKPTEYVRSGAWRVDFPSSNDRTTFYRMINYGKLHDWFERLDVIYAASSEATMQDFFNKRTNSVNLCQEERTAAFFAAFCAHFGVDPRTPQKKLRMFFRWMVRPHSPVDFGLWTTLSPADLILPLDTHVVEEAAELGLLPDKRYSYRAALQLTAALRLVFPDDPCRGDFALFGYGVNKA